MLRILHISDFHICNKNLAFSKEILKALVEKLEDINREKSINLIIFSGDAINQGGDFDSTGKITSYTLFEQQVIEPLLVALNLDRSRFIMVPGNHDIQRDRLDEIIEMGLRNFIKNEESIIQAYKINKKLFSRCEEYKKFEESFYPHSCPDFEIHIHNAQSVFKIKIKDIKIGIVGMNTAWRCYKSDEDHIHNVAGIFQLEESLPLIEDCEIKIAISHHHHSMLKDFDNKAIGSFLLENFSLYFTGHQHSPDADLHVKPKGCLYNFVAPGVLYENTMPSSNYKNGFTIIDYDLPNGVCQARYYYQQLNKKFEIDKNIGKNGIWTTQIPLGEEAIRRREIQNIYSEIEEQSSEWNQHLLGWDRKTEERQTIKDIFVMPQIKFADISDPQSNEPDRYIASLQELIEIEGNVLIEGVKESGKTLMIDRLILELLDNRSKYNLLPARINIDKKESIISQIANFWGKSRTSVKEILSSEKCLLMIDDINIDEHPDFEDMLTSFHIKYPNIKVLATYRRNMGMDISSSIRLSKLNFTILEIQSFGAKQVRELTKKWFKDSIDNHEENYISTIIDTLSGLKLPPSPFAISMFLSILQKNKSSRPKNQSLLTKEYIEELLKHNIPDTHSRNDFNSQNRLHLLTHITRKMYDKIQTTGKHGLTSAETHLEIESYLNDTGLNNDRLKLFSARKILDELIESSIIIEEGNEIRFRFRCFYEFFLALNMIQSSMFKHSILNDYLSHYNEIVFYTGLKTNDNEALTQVIKDLTFEYPEVDLFIKERCGNKIDNLFKYTKSLVSELEDSDLSSYLPDKQTEEDKIRIEDKKLESNHDSEEPVKNLAMPEKIQKIINFGDRLMLAMNILRNVEDLLGYNEKYNAYITILKKTMTYACLYAVNTQYLLFHKSENERKEAQCQQLYMTLRILPALNAEFMFRNLGSMKLTSIIKAKIDADKKIQDISDFEKYISVFLYSEIKGPNFINELKEFCQKYQRAYIADSIMMKLHHYYYTSHISDERTLTNMIADVYIKEHTDHNPRKRLDKSDILIKLESTKRKFDLKQKE